jgi:uncharacterized glyoxalase superfamily protein PhnB
MNESGSPSRPTTYVWPSLTYADAPAAIEFLATAFGFVATAVYKADDDDTVVHHAELSWSPGGGIMLGTQRDSSGGPGTTGQGACYVVTDDPDGLYARAVSAGATVVRELEDQDYGSREFSVRDPEGNLWSFGTYAGE